MITPVTVLTGFLGAGKTTLLKRVLEQPQGVRFGVLVNDFGAVNVDAELIAQTGADSIALSNGCICCSIRDDLGEALERLLAMDPPPERIIIEASGVSRPLSIIAAVEQDAFAQRLSVDATICLVDADQFPAFDYAATELAIDQAGSSDLLVINKCDLAAPESIAATETALLGPNPDSRHIRTAHAAVAHDILFGPDLRRAAVSIDDHVCGVECGPHGAEGHAHHTHDHTGNHAHSHEDVFESSVWTSAKPLEFESLLSLRQGLPRGLLRAKGVVRVGVDGRARRAVIQLVGKRCSVVLQDGDAPTDSRVVFIALRGGLDRMAIARALEDCLSADSSGVA